LSWYEKSLCNNCRLEEKNKKDISSWTFWKWTSQTPVSQYRRVWLGSRGWKRELRLVRVCQRRKEMLRNNILFLSMKRFSFTFSLYVPSLEEGIE
jgi:hypothetical protein